MKIRFLLLALLILSSTTLQGCWDYIEYENMAQVIGMGFDFNKETNQTTVTLQYTATSKQGKGASGDSSKSSQGTQWITYSATDRTFFGALNKLQEVIFKRLFYGYLKVIVIGQDAAKYDVADIVETCDRSPAIRSTAYFAVSAGRADQALRAVDSSNTISPSQQIYNLINFSETTGAAYPVTFKSFLDMLVIGGLEAVAPGLVSVSLEAQKPESRNRLQGEIEYDGEYKGDQKLSMTAAFKGNKLAGWLNEKEGPGLGWITGKNIISYKMSEPSSGTNIEDIFYYRMSKSKSTMKVLLENGNPVAYVNVKATADIRKYYGNKDPEVISSEEINDMERKLSDSIRSDIQAALNKGQKELKSDIFGFGFAFFRKYPKLWQTEYEAKWDDIFPDMPVHINVDSKIVNTGTNNRKLIMK